MLSSRVANYVDEMPFQNDQTQKVKYFTRYYKKDSLVPSLNTLYKQYNAIINRMLTLKDEESAINIISEN